MRRTEAAQRDAHKQKLGWKWGAAPPGVLAAEHASEMAGQRGGSRAVLGCQGRRGYVLLLSWRGRGSCRCGCPPLSARPG